MDNLLTMMECSEKIYTALKKEGIVFMPGYNPISYEADWDAFCVFNNEKFYDMAERFGKTVNYSDKPQIKVISKLAYFELSHYVVYSAVLLSEIGKYDKNYRKDTEFYVHEI